MDDGLRIESCLAKAVETAEGSGCPPRLAAAIQHAVFPGGARIRPRLCLAVAKACGDDDPDLTDSAASAIELLHCASLVHDDLPCFDNADTRRGKPTVHRAFGERLGVLAGDALIVRAFEVIAASGAGSPERIAPLIGIIGRAVGFPSGITAGQAWECEPRVKLADYHQAKTGALFIAATEAGATAAGADPVRWRALGRLLGEAYQVADDIADTTASASDTGKTSQRDAILGRPNAALELGVKGALDRLETLVCEALAAIPPCAGHDDLGQLVVGGIRRFLPKVLVPRSLMPVQRPGKDGQPWIA